MKPILNHKISKSGRLIWPTLLTLVLSVFLSACDSMNLEKNMPSSEAHGESKEIEVEKGLHNGRLLKDGDFTLELAIFETGVPPEFRAWATKNGKKLEPAEVDLNIKLTRLGGKIDNINFQPQGDAMRGDTIIYEPHSFVVTINAIHNKVKHTWKYDTFEGRTKIKSAVAKALEIETEIAGSVKIPELLTVYGKITANTERLRKVSARFDGVIQTVIPTLGSNVRKGQKLATVESNESLKIYTITAPINGVLTERSANPGEQTDGRQLFTIMNISSVWAELSIFPSDLLHVKVGAPVTITTTVSGNTISGKISRINVISEADQSVKAHVILSNKKGNFLPGHFVTATIKVAEHSASLAVKRSGLQPYRDFTVVYAQIGEEYEVRMLELGFQSDEWAEVLSGLEPGTRYVSEHSYVIKADIEKSGASHDH